MMGMVVGMIWPALRMLGMQGLSWLWALVLTPLGRALLIGALTTGGYLWWEARTREAGAVIERAATAERMRQAETAAQSEQDAIRDERDAAAARDEAELAALAVQQEGMRNAEADGDRVLWRADDGWLRGKLAAAGADRAGPGAEALPGARRGGSPRPRPAAAAAAGR
jgi:hypothetical protein